MIAAAEECVPGQDARGSVGHHELKWLAGVAGEPPPSELRRRAGRGHCQQVPAASLVEEAGRLARGRTGSGRTAGFPGRPGEPN